MARLYMHKRPDGAFVPADEPSAEVSRKYKANQVYRCDLVRPRSYEHHKLCMALLNLTYLNLPEKLEALWPTFDLFRYAVAEAAGHFIEYVTIEGEVKRTAKSISYDAIPDDVEFGKVMAGMMTVCARILDVSEPELAGEVSRYADAQYGQEAA